MVRMHRIALRPLLALLGVYHLLLGVAMAAAPRTFFDDVATYGAFNDHYIRDVATFYLALGAVLFWLLRGGRGAPARDDGAATPPR
jgi:hypothetical protein